MGLPGREATALAEPAVAEAALAETALKDAALKQAALTDAVITQAAAAQATAAASTDAALVQRRALELAGIRLTAPPRVLRDTSNYIGIDRGDVLELGGERFLVCGNEREGRFGIDDQPKFWVKRAVSLDTGRAHVVKLVFRESFTTSVDGVRFEAVRSPEKEAQVLEAVGGHPNFMHGRSVVDEGGNVVRILDFIEGESLLRYLGELPLPHERYAAEVLPGLLAKVHACVAGIAYLHERGLCHGDIRNDHVILDARDGTARWIDFDFDRPTLLFDVWCLGNVLNCVVAKGFVTFHGLRRARPDVVGRLDEGDASAFFGHRVMRLEKVYPHIPPPLARILDRYAVSGRARYERAQDVADELASAMDALGWRTAPAVAGARGE